MSAADAPATDAEPGPTPPPSVPAAARVIHRTRERLRLRVPSRRRDLGFFLGLYEDLHRRPEIDAVQINPTTGSVLVEFDRAAAGGVPTALAAGGFLALETAPAPGSAATRAAGPGRGAGTPASALPEAGNPHHFHRRINDMRILVFVIMLGLSMQQLLKGQWLLPLVTLVLYLADLAAGLRREGETAPVDHPAAEAADTR
jgi:hypothetical protein